MKNRLVQSVKATISSIIVALLISGLLLLCIKLFLGRKIDEIFTLVNKVSIATNEKAEPVQTTISTDESTDKSIIKNYPEYGTQYATIEIDKIDVKLVFKKGTVEIYDNKGKLIETVGQNNGKLAYTGNNVNVVLTTSVIATIALAITVVTKRTVHEK